MSKRILYVTIDGVLQPLAYSQVCRVLMGLQRLGYDYDLVSLESPQDLADPGRAQNLSRELAETGINWSYLPYDQGGTARAAARNLANLGRLAARSLRERPARLIHARAYHAAAIALSLRSATRVPYLFDARGRWIDERLLGRRWFTNPAVEKPARFVERQLYSRAAAFVTLTQLHADDIAAGDFGSYRGAPMRVVTTCADFASFPLELRHAPPPLAETTAAELRGKLVLGLVGSMNAFYRHDDAMKLTRAIFERRPDAHLLVISAQRREFEALIQRHGLPASRTTLITANHKEMPGWLARIDWAIQLLNGGIAKRGSMPTKLAEFFAAGVRPIHYGCNDEVSAWVDRAGSGIVLPSLAPEALEQAAARVASSRLDAQVLAIARERTREHFDLAAGLATYDSLLRELGCAPSC